MNRLFVVCSKVLVIVVVVAVVVTVVLFVDALVVVGFAVVDVVLEIASG